jgi:hypothetical protein
MTALRPDLIRIDRPSPGQPLWRLILTEDAPYAPFTWRASDASLPGLIGKVRKARRRFGKPPPLTW